MAAIRPENAFVMVRLVLGCAALIMSSELSSAAGGESISPDSSEGSFDIDDDYPPKPSPRYYKQLEECERQISSLCAEEILEGIFVNEPLTENCCREVVHIGYECYNGLVKLMLMRSELPRVPPSDALAKSLQMWEKCVSVVQALPPAPVA